MKNISLSAPVDTLFSTGNSINASYEPQKALGMKVSDVQSNMTLGNTSQNANYIGDVLPNKPDMGMTQAFNQYAGYYWSFWQPYNTYYHGCYHTFTTPDKFEIAFNLSRKLMEKKLVKPLKMVEDFFKLMDAIVEVL